MNLSLSNTAFNKLSRDKVQLLLGCQIATLVLAALLTTPGIVTPAAASYFGVSATTMAAMFSWFTAAAFIGQASSIVLFDHLPVKRTLTLCHLGTALVLVWLSYTESIGMFALALFLCGLLLSLALCASGTLISQQWQGNAREAAIVGQDVMFNGGGLLFAGLTTAYLSEEGFSVGWMAAAIACTMAFLLLVTTRISPEPDLQEVETSETNWNLRVVIIGLSLLGFVAGKVAFLIWAPQFVAQRFGASAEVVGAFVSNIFTAALVGSVLIAVLVRFVDIRLPLYAMLILCFGCCLALLWIPTLSATMWLGLIYGVSVSATFNAYVAFALNQVDIPTHRHIAFMLLMSSLGSAVAPVLSSSIVAWKGEIEATIQATCTLLAVVLLALLVVEFLRWQTTAVVQELNDN